MSAPVRVWVVSLDDGSSSLFADRRQAEYFAHVEDDSDPELHEYILASSLPSERETLPRVEAAQPATGPEAA